MNNLKYLYARIKKNWREPDPGNYVPYKEIVNIGVAGFGVHWTTTLASTIFLDASSFLVGTCIGLRPLHLSIMLIVANLVGMPLAFFRGWFFDNHKMPGGKFIPIMLRTPVPIVVISALFVWLPFEKWSYVTNVIVVWCFYMALQFFLCFYNDGWAFFQQVTTPNSEERAYVMSVSQIIYSLAPTITGFVTLTLAELTFGLETIWSYRVIYLPFSVVGVIIILIFFPKLKERIILPKRGVEYVSIIDALREVSKNKYFWIINSAGWIGFLEGAYGAILGWSFVFSQGGKNGVYYGTAHTLINNAALWAMILAPFLMNLIGKRRMLIAHNVINIVLLLLLMPFYQNLIVVCVIFYLNTFVNTFQNIYFPNIQADMRDYHQWKTGTRVDGLFLPLGIIGTVIGFATGLVVPTIQEYMGLKQDYSVLYNDEVRNNLFDVLIMASIVGAILNLIPYLFYDLTEEKHRGYVNVLKIRAMFEDYGNGELEDEQLIEAMKIINAARDNLQKKPLDKSRLRAAKKIKDKQEQARLTEMARNELREIRLHNRLVSSLPIVSEELNKFNTKRYQIQLERAKSTVALGEIYLYSDWKEEKRQAKAMSRATKEEKVIRSDAIRLADDKKQSFKLLRKHGMENLVAPDNSIPEEIKSRSFKNEKERRSAKKELKAYTRAASVYRRITKPYYDANNLIIQEENFGKFSEINELYERVMASGQES